MAGSQDSDRLLANRQTSVQSLGMPRHKTISDTEALRQVRHTLLGDGEKAVTFASAAKACSLAAPTLVQRFGTRDAMVIAALMAGWDALAAATDAADAAALVSHKGALALLKTVAAEEDIPALLAASLRYTETRDRMLAWRSRVEAALTPRFGGGVKGRETAAMIFAVWQGRMIWDAAGGKGFRLNDLLKRLT